MGGKKIVDFREVSLINQLSKLPPSWSCYLPGSTTLFSSSTPRIRTGDAKVKGGFLKKISEGDTPLKFRVGALLLRGLSKHSALQKTNAVSL